MTITESEDIGRQLRIEAGPARWGEFDSAQRNAYLHLAQMIVEALVEMPSLESGSSKHESVRRTRTAFLSGGRGTGKTTVMASLKRDSEADPIEASHSADAQRDAIQMRSDKVIDRIRGHVVWLETLDMEPLPRNTNLIAAILVRLEDAAKQYGASPSTHPPRGLLEPSSEYHSALLDLQRLQTDVALAWDGNLDERRGQLDPDAYAVEMMRTEHARLSINKKFSETLQKLANYVFRGMDVHGMKMKNPLFILPVDDFDLNPPICLDLLRVLRLISAPRLFTIVLGDLQVASTVLALKLSNDLGSIADSDLKQNMLAVDPERVGALAGDVAANALRKLLPPGQRVELSPMSLAEALNFKPLGAKNADPYLHLLLGHCPVYVKFDLGKVPGTESTLCESRRTDPPPAGGEQRMASLRQLLLAPGVQLFDSPFTEKLKTQDELHSEVTNSVVYSGTSFVKAPPRHVADTWLKLYRITGYPQVKSPEEIAGPLVEHFAEVAQAALRETPAFTPDERDNVERAIDRTIAGSWTLRALPIAVLAETTPAAMVELTFPELTTQPRLSKTKTDPNLPVPPPPRTRIVTAESLGWQMALPRRGRTRLPGISNDPWMEELPSPGRLLPDNTVSALILYHDLLTSARESSAFVTPLLTRSNLRVDLATTDWHEQELVSFPWPIPPARTFFNLDRFKSAWNEAIKNEDVIGETELMRRAERLAFAWLSAGTAVVIHQEAIRVPGRSDDVPWSNLAEQLNQAAIDVTGGHQAGYREWLLRALELLMPEMGMAELELQQNLLKIFNAKKKLMEFWQENRLVLQQRRAERLARLSDIDAVLAERLRASKKGLAGKFIPAKKRVESLTRPGRRQQPDQDGTGGLS